LAAEGFFLIDEAFLLGGKMTRRVKMTAAKAEEMQQRIEAGLVSELFPKVTIICY
jgi:hypothetical protein